MLIYVHVTKQSRAQDAHPLWSHARLFASESRVTKIFVTETRPTLSITPERMLSTITKPYLNRVSDVVCFYTRVFTPRFIEDVCYHACVSLKAVDNE